MLLWGTDTTVALVLAAGGSLPMVPSQLMATGCESGHGAALLVAAHPTPPPPHSTAVGTQGLISDHAVGLAVMSIAIKAASFPQGL